MSEAETVIDRLGVRCYEIPTDRPESDGTLSWDSTTIVIVHAHSGDHHGLGYTYGPRQIAGVVTDLLAPVVCGIDALSPPLAWEAMHAALRNAGQSGIGAMALSAVDLALHDLRARLLGLSLAQSIGRLRDGACVYGSGGFTTYGPDEVAEQLGDWVGQGIARVKMKVGRRPRRGSRPPGCRTPGDRQRRRADGRRQWRFQRRARRSRGPIATPTTTSTISRSRSPRRPRRAASCSRAVPGGDGDRRGRVRLGPLRHTPSDRRRCGRHRPGRRHSMRRNDRARPHRCAVRDPRPSAVGALRAGHQRARGLHARASSSTSSTSTTTSGSSSSCSTGCSLRSAARSRPISPGPVTASSSRPSTRSATAHEPTGTADDRDHRCHRRRRPRHRPRLRPEGSSARSARPRPGGLEATANEVRALGGTPLPISVDVADPDAVERAAAQVETAFGPIDLWVNNAMAAAASRPWTTSPRIPASHRGHLPRRRPRHAGRAPPDAPPRPRPRSSWSGRRSRSGGSRCKPPTAPPSMRSRASPSRCAASCATAGACVPSIVHLPGLNTTQFGWVRLHVPNEA